MNHSYAKRMEYSGTGDVDTYLGRKGKAGSENVFIIDTRETTSDESVETTEGGGGQVDAVDEEENIKKGDEESQEVGSNEERQPEKVGNEDDAVNNDLSQGKDEVLDLLGEENDFTLSTVLTSCARTCGLDHGRQVHTLAVKTNFQSHIFVASSLLDMYAKSGGINEARRIFDAMSERDVVSCSAMLAGYAQLGQDEEALKLFHKLYKEGIECNYVTFTSLLNAVSGMSDLDYDKQVHSLTIRRELSFYVVLQNSLIDMYSKCGCLGYSKRVFDNMSERTISSWNAMLVGYCKHGVGREVVDLFKSMPREMKPDSVTYIAVLSGCSHGGLADEGLEIFDNMIRGGMEPETGHYACVVDLLGRAGRIEKALDFIRKVPFEATPVMWSSLLGACRLHANDIVGEFAAQRLLAIEPQNDGSYVILSNIYSAAGRWKDAIRIRELMKDNSVTKEPGRSCVNLDRMVHTFLSGGRSHPQKDEIEAKVKELSAKIKEAGYVPDLNCVLHDEQQERILLGHSEKLAIAFVLMGTAKSEVIRITNNLRICVDCHNFAKFVSKVYGRQLSLRDNNRFHMMVGGACSCGDYW